MRRKKYSPGGAQFILQQNYQFPPPVCAYSITWFWSFVSHVFYALCWKRNGRTEIAHKSLWRGKWKTDSVKLVLNEHPMRACGSTLTD